MLDYPDKHLEGLVKTPIFIALVCSLGAIVSAHAATLYYYDDLGRLKQAKYDNGKEIDYTYDQAGNRTSVATSTSTPHGAMLTAPTKSKHKRVRRH